tara:strand:+ start:6450 stop:6659 length:210 start_codon:yes stop_codon:yes gene_type:complete
MSRAKQVMVSTISRKSPNKAALPRWVWIAGAVALAVIVYAWIDGGYRDVRPIEQPLDPVTATDAAGEDA